MKNFLKVFTFLFSLFISFHAILAQSNIPTWQFTPPKVITAVPVQSNASNSSNVSFASTETYTDNQATEANKADNKQFYPFSNRHYRFLKVVPEGASASDYAPNTFYEVGQSLPNIQLPNPNGRKVNLTETKGKYTLVHFWASWCPTSMIKVPHYQTLYKKYANATFPNADGFEIYAISLDKEQKDWKKAIEENNLTWKFNTLEDGEVGNNTVQALNVDIIPASYLLDPNGVIIGKNMCESVLDYTLSKQTRLAKERQQPLHNETPNFLSNTPTRNIPSRLASHSPNTTPPLQSTTINYRVEIGTFPTLAFHDFSHLQYLGKIYQEPAIGEKGVRVLVGDYPNRSIAQEAATKLFHNGYYNAQIISYRFQKPNNNEQIAEQPSITGDTNNVFAP